MRTIEEIRQSMATAFMNDATLAGRYGFTVDADFDATFSSVSIERIIIYIVAVATWVLESLFDEHKKDVDARIEEILPHRPKWYRDKALAFMKDKTLISDTDVYDTTGMSESDIDDAKVVKYAAATESEESSILTVKIATKGNDGLEPLDTETATEFLAYMKEIKDAGVRLQVVNQEADRLTCSLTIYYDAILTGSDVQEAVEAAVQEYVQSLPFNGEYTNMALVDKLQTVGGVKIAEVTESKATPLGGAVQQIDARYRPVAGYLTVEQITTTMIAYE
ncbi:MAG: hypothetical protein IJ782_01990 [Prevotella sp.]|nr:hypothetical protein [Prevotella sp.]